MKILIGYDGSDCGDAMVEDLCRAGLPETGEALVLSAVEASSRFDKQPALAISTGYDFPSDQERELLNEDARNEARVIATLAMDRLKARFPQWRIISEGIVNSPQSAIVDKAEEWKPDLIALGSHGRSGFKRLVLGSVSEHVLNHTACSVRIGRRGGKHEHPIRLLIGADGSPGANAALQAIAARNWPGNTQIRVVSVVDSRAWLMASTVADPGSVCMPAVEEELQSEATGAAEQAVQYLKNAGLHAVSKVAQGNPGDVLVAEAEQWDADCIFVGARGLHVIGRLFLGSVSNDVVSRASCSVEVIRSRAS